MRRRDFLRAAAVSPLAAVFVGFHGAPGGHRFTRVAEWLGRGGRTAEAMQAAGLLRIGTEVTSLDRCTLSVKLTRCDLLADDGEWVPVADAAKEIEHATP